MKMGLYYSDICDGIIEFGIDNSGNIYNIYSCEMSLWWGPEFKNKYWFNWGMTFNDETGPKNLKIFMQELKPVYIGKI